MPTDVHEQMAHDYLHAVLLEDAPAVLTAVASFDEAPLEGEGKTTVFAFNARLGGNAEEPFYVVAGQTVANYYPQWGLDADQIYSVHIGTRFMLVVEVQQLALADVPSEIAAQLREELEGVVPGASISDIQPVAAFKAEDHTHVVCRARVDDEDVYAMAADLPLGLYRETHLPAHVVYRWHLGNVIRMERPCDDDTEAEPSSTPPA